jgi:hypothetical protein
MQESRRIWIKGFYARINPREIAASRKDSSIQEGAIEKFDTPTAPSAFECMSSPDVAFQQKGDVRQMLNKRKRKQVK